MISNPLYFYYAEGNILWHFYWFDSKQKHFNCSSHQKKSCFQTDLNSTASVRPACLGTQKHIPDSLLLHLMLSRGSSQTDTGKKWEVSLITTSCIKTKHLQKNLCPWQIAMWELYKPLGNVWWPIGTVFSIFLKGKSPMWAMELLEFYTPSSNILKPF